MDNTPIIKLHILQKTNLEISSMPDTILEVTFRNEMESLGGKNIQSRDFSLVFPYSDTLIHV